MVPRRRGCVRCPLLCEFLRRLPRSAELCDPKFPPRVPDWFGCLADATSAESVDKSRDASAPANAARCERMNDHAAAARAKAAVLHELSATGVLSRPRTEALREGDGARHAARVQSLKSLGRRFRLGLRGDEEEQPSGTNVIQACRDTDKRLAGDPVTPCRLVQGIPCNPWKPWTGICNPCNLCEV